jgi:hypothetical protein
MTLRAGKTTVHVQEPGFEGQVTVGPGRRVRISGIRPQDGSAIVKDLPIDRDQELVELAERVGRGDEGAAPRLVAHLGVVDPPSD